MHIEIPDTLYEKYRQLVKQRYFSDDVPSHLFDLIETELRRSGVPGYETDRLTGCKTRYQLESDINRASWGNSSQDHSIYRNSYLCLDIDNFKNYVDTIGLTASDEALKDIGELLRQTYTDANVYRFGGDEFVVDLGERQYSPVSTPSGIQLKYSIVRVSVARNQHRNHYINRVIIFHLDKGIVEATQRGTEIDCKMELT